MNFDTIVNSQQSIYEYCFQCKILKGRTTILVASGGFLGTDIIQTHHNVIRRDVMLHLQPAHESDKITTFS